MSQLSLDVATLRSETPHPAGHILLRSYQEAALSAVRSAETMGNRRQVVVLPTGCLAGSTLININRGGKGFRIPIERLVKRLHGDDALLPGPKWDTSIPTFAACAEDGVIRLGEVATAWESGLKATYTLTTESGRSIRATAEHPFLTPSGWVTLGDLSIGDSVLVNAGRSTKGRSVKFHDRRVAGMEHHPFAVRILGRRKDRNDEHIAGVAYHRLVAEAKLNQIPIEIYIAQVRSGDIAGLQFVDPSTHHVHHEDRNHYNDAPANVAVLEKTDHLREHGSEFARHVLEQVGEDRIASITPFGTEQTYDIAMVDDPHNFIADGFVVHNSGKTIVFASLIQRMGARALVLAHRDELIQQAVDKIRTVMPKAHVGVVKAEKNDGHAPIVVASIQTLASEKRRRQIADQNWDLVVCDECHHAAAKSYRDLFDALGAGAKGGPLLLGVTATPDRGDRIRLDDVFDGIVYQVGLLDLIAQGHLCDVQAVRVSIQVDMDSIRKTAGDYNQGDLERALENADQPAQTAIAIKEHAADRRTLVFTASVALAEETAAEIAALGIRCEWVSGNMPMVDRRAILARFQSGETQCVVNCMVLTEGFDCPEVDCVAIARPTTSRALYQQMVGRGLRNAPGKSNCLVIDVVGVTQRHDLQTAATLAGVDFSKGAGNGESMMQAIEGMGGNAIDPVTGQMVSIPVDLFHKSRLNWVRPQGTTAWTIPFDGESSLAITPASIGWDIIKVTNGKGIEVVEQYVDGSLVQGMAEEIVRRTGDGRLNNRYASWRDQEPTEKQLGCARWLRVDLDAVAAANDGRLTKGAVSDAIQAADMSKAINTWTRARQRNAA